MRKINVGVVEDERAASDILAEYLAKFGAENGREFEISRFYNVTEFLAAFHNDFDILFMDIELPDGSGMEAAAKVRQKDKDVTVIFVTNMSQYAIKGYEVRAFDFIVKPVSYKNFALKLTGALDCLKRKIGKDIWLSNKDGKKRINTSRIRYVEVLQHILVFHTLDGDFKQSGTLSSLQEQLSGEPFSLCNRCYLVNLKYVTAVKQFEASLGSEKLQISRLKRNSFMCELNDFLAGGD